MDKQTHYDERTPLIVQQILEAARLSKDRLRLFFGDTETGRDWMEEHDIIGTIGRSTGTQPCALLIHNARSIGGGAILTHCIVKIMTIKGRTLYQHDKYHLPTFHISTKPEHITEDLGWAVLANMEVHARFKQQRQAERWIEFIQGARMAK